jgi:hypothetical protein
MESLARQGAGEMLVGMVERVTFHNAETGFRVRRVQVRGRRGLTTVVGRAAVITPGERIQATGRWVNDRSHGLRFQAFFPRLAPPASSESLERYLSSGLIRGIGPVYGRNLIAAAFGMTGSGTRRHRSVPRNVAVSSALIASRSSIMSGSSSGGSQRGSTLSPLEVSRWRRYV